MRTREEILDTIEAEDVEFIRLQFTDIFGTLKNIAVTAGQMERALDNKVTFNGSFLYGDQKADGEDLYLRPDLDSFVILPWRPQQGKVARLLCDVCRADGTLLEESPRQILKRTLNRAAEKGYTFYVHPECEFFLFHTDENGIPTTVTHDQAGYMDIAPLDLGENARRDMVLTLEEMGFQVESSHHEKAPAQHEIDFAFAKAMETADQIVTFKTAVRSTAKRFGLHATFMPKPRAGAAGSGMHLNITLFQGGRNVFEDPEKEDGLSDEARWFVGGVMRHARAMCAVTNPLVNSYKRLMSGFDAPRDIIWTVKNRNALIRIPSVRGEETGVELRFPDPSANPYLALAACLAAGMEGMEQRIEPGALAKDVPDDMTEEQKAKAGILRLPETLWEAALEMEKDAFMKRVLGEEFVRLYAAGCRAEWNEYMSQVSEWEVEKYLYRT